MGKSRGMADQPEPLDPDQEKERLDELEDQIDQARRQVAEHQPAADRAVIEPEEQNDAAGEKAAADVADRDGVGDDEGDGEEGVEDEVGD